MNPNELAATIDVRQFASAVKHQTIFAVWNALSVGCRMRLINDHDPKPLYYQLAAEYPDQFVWTYRKDGPAVWEVDIEKCRGPEILTAGQQEALDHAQAIL